MVAWWLARHPMRLRFVATVAVLLATIVACVEQPKTSPRRLSSGRDLEVIWMGLVPSNPTSWVLKYRTDIPISERPRVQCEVMALWPDFHAEAELSKATRASLWPNNFDREIKFDGWWPVVWSNRSTAFSFERTEAGDWEGVGGWTSAACGE